ncbi:MAG TPA: S9 family peptidase [Bacteroidia bacterium]|jgi:dipeptidyl aminopeptidase/acylaminoacyl peptidase|nr:S9 family peptidase [Bacteroidia bacterium]
MKKTILALASLAVVLSCQAQQTLTPEMLIQLGKINTQGISKDGKSIIFSVRMYNVAEGKSSAKEYSMPVGGGAANEINNGKDLLVNDRISPDGKHSISSNDVKVKKVYGKDFYPELTKSDVMIYDNLNYRHWDTWEDGNYGHVFLNTLKDKKVSDSTDIMPGEAFDCPQKPYGGDEDFIWSHDGKRIVYVTKKKYGKDYAISTNTDLYAYDLETGKTTDLTPGMEGYDVKPAFSVNGTLAWLSMKTEGNESDKNDIVVMNGTEKTNLTKDWDNTVDDFKWSNDGKKLFFTAPIDGSIQLFEVNNVTDGKKPVITQITKTDGDVHKLVGEAGNEMIIERTDMNHAAEIYAVDLRTGAMKQLSHVNDKVYSTLAMPKFEKRYVTTTDGLKMLVWVILPPNFDATKKYPTLLYCQGGPQSALTQFYSFRWNFQLMASNGYIVVAPNRRGMPGHGVKWNEQISLDYGGQPMRDYLSAIDEVAKEPYVDKNRLGCVGASYGGYSVFFLAGMHEKRFKTFIAHDGIFDWRSMYGTTEELWFVNHDLGGAYWNKENAVTQKSYEQFNPVNFVKKWDTPILIIQGGKDYRVPIEQGLGAFQAAQLQGIKSKLLYFPTENHWITKEQDALVWQHEFYKWLKETL